MSVGQAPAGTTMETSPGLVIAVGSVPIVAPAAAVTTAEYSGVGSMQVVAAQ